MNSVNLVGRLARDPELRYTPQGTGVCNFTIKEDAPSGAAPRGNDPPPEDDDVPF